MLVFKLNLMGGARMDESGNNREKVLHLCGEIDKLSPEEKTRNLAIVDRSRLVSPSVKDVIHLLCAV